MGEVLHGSLLQLLLEHCDFLIIDISQGSVATRLRCGGIFKYGLVANLSMSQPVKEFWKSINIWGSYGQEFGVLFFSETQCRVSGLSCGVVCVLVCSTVLINTGLCQTDRRTYTGRHRIYRAIRARVVKSVAKLKLVHFPLSVAEKLCTTGWIFRLG